MITGSIDFAVDDFAPSIWVAWHGLEGTSGYSTVYEFTNTAKPESPEWKEQQQHSSPIRRACGRP